MLPPGWNDILTVVALLVSAVTAFFQIRDFRARPAKPSIARVHKPGFKTRRDDETPDGRVEAQFTLDVDVENEGRTGFTISYFQIELPDGKESEMEVKQFSNKRLREFDGYASRELSLQADTTLPEDHPNVVEATIRLVTPAGEDTEQVTFHLLDRRV